MLNGVWTGRNSDTSRPSAAWRADLQDFAQPQVALRAPAFELRVGFDQRDRGRTRCQDPTLRQVAAQRRRDRGVERLVLRRDHGARNVLEHAAHYELAWQRVAPVQLELRRAAEWHYLMAVWQLLRRIDEIAVIGDRAPEVHAAAEVAAPSEPRGDGAGEEVRRCGNRPRGRRPIRGLPSTCETLLIFPIVFAAGGGTSLDKPAGEHPSIKWTLSPNEGRCPCRNLPR